MSAVAGWYTDPSGVTGQLRWWDGERWTDHVTPDPAFAPAEQAEPDVTDVITEPEATSQAEPEPTPEPDPEPVPAAVEPEPVPEPDPEPAPAAAEPEPAPEPEPPPAPDPVPAPDPEPVSTAVEPDPPAVSESPGPPTVPPPGAADGGPVWGSGAVAGGAGFAAASSGTASAPSTPPPGAPGATPTWGDTSGGWADTSSPTSWDPVEPTRSSKGARTGLLLVGIAAFVVLAGVAFVSIGVFSGISAFDGDDFGGTAFDGDDFGGTAGDVEFGGEVRVGDVVSGSVPWDGAFEVDLVIDAFSDVTIDVRGQGGFDGVAELRDGSGDTRAFNDDRGGSGVQRVGGDDLDPLLEVDLEAGTYRLSIRGFAGESGGFEVSIS
ncbi:DUF2510 domain-containing protein [Nitriliruptor alkaliphilus]|uniref:DUF2510 domain-containing protein n=1 Tax=Nitriliruptor alkaliphilus TaxID=427918 RepID=UPI000695AB00|nr:DUF2510 domain-containing protein [Nitriliruptor alkaliphilus]